MPTSCCLCAGCAVVKLSTVPYGEFMHKCINIVEPIANRGVEGLRISEKSLLLFPFDSLLFFLLLLRKRFYVKFKSRLRKSSEWISGKFFLFCFFYFYVGTFT